MISAAELASMQATVATSFDATVAIQRNASGTWTTVATLPCAYGQVPRLPQENASETQRLSIDDRWRFRFAAGADVRFQDRISTGGGRRFEVIQVPVGSLEISRDVLAQELDV